MIGCKILWNEVKEVGENFMKRILIFIMLVISLISPIKAKAIDSYDQKPCEYYYSVVFNFYEEDLRRPYAVTDFTAYDCIGRTDRHRMTILFKGGGAYDPYIAGIIDTEDPKIKKVVLMWGQSVDDEEGWENTECMAITDPSLVNNKWVWGESIGYAYPFKITERDYEIFIEGKGEYVWR